MNRTQIINALIKKNDYKTYLEIGVNTPAQPGYSHDKIIIETKHGVDPNVNTTFKMTSDEFFEKHIKMNYDIVFIDGLHIFEQTYRDIINSLEHLNESGTIIVHDCNPIKEVTQRTTRAKNIWQRVWHGIRYNSWYGVWHGDVWKAILKLRMEKPNVQIYTISADEGCSIIQKGSQILFKPTETKEDIYAYGFFKKNKKEILNLIDVKEFKDKLSIPL